MGDMQAWRQSQPEFKNRTGLLADIFVKQPVNAIPYTPSDLELATGKKFLLSGGHRDSFTP
jgi:hypothetical protein